jgi:hypothetical protein
MPSALHEVIGELFREGPELAAELLTLALDRPLPEFDRARTESGDFPDISPTEYRADAVVVLEAADAPALAIVVEAQLRHDPDKSWSWPVYVTTLRARLHCPTQLLVLCPSDRIATRLRRPIEIGHGHILYPTVVSPAGIPVVTEPEIVADKPGLAALSAIAHHRHPDYPQILTVFAENVIAAPSPERYIDLVAAALPETARNLLEAIMTSETYTYRSEFARRYEAKGREAGLLAGETRSLLTVLRARFQVPPSTAALVESCTDAELLNHWIGRAATAANLDAVFTD